jgi:hypothetical protein
MGAHSLTSQDFLITRELAVLFVNLANSTRMLFQLTTRAIKIALRKIREHHPALGQHLATTVKTGTYCSYTPDVRMPITWQG